MFAVEEMAEDELVPMRVEEEGMGAMRWGSRVTGGVAEEERVVTNLVIEFFERTSESGHSTL